MKKAELDQKVNFSNVFIPILIFLLILSFSFHLQTIDTYGKTIARNYVFDNENIQFSTNVLLSVNDTIYPQHVEPTLDISPNNTIFVGWKNAYTHNSGGVRVSFTKSSDNGLTWTSPIDMPMFKGMFTSQSDPWIVFYNNTLFYTYLEFNPYSNNFTQITLAKSQNYGQSWKLIPASNGTGFADKETFTVYNNTIYMTYDDIGNETLTKLTRSDDFGDSFKEISIIPDNNTFDYAAPYVTTNSSGAIYVAWLYVNKTTNFGDVFIDYSTDKGVTFHNDTDINPDGNFGTALEYNGRPTKITLPVIKFDSKNRLYCLWSDLAPYGTDWNIFLKYSDDYGKTWSQRIPIDNQTVGNQWLGDFEIDSQNNLHVVYMSELNGWYKPYYSLITFKGSNYTISSPVPVANEYTSSDFVRPGDYLTIKVDSSNIPHVVWTDGRDYSLNIYYAHRIKQEQITTSKNLSSSINSSKSSETTNLIFNTDLIPLMIILVFIVLKRKKFEE